MEIKIESPHFKLDQKLNDYLLNRVKHLEHLNERLIMAEVTLKLEKSSTENNKICEIKVFGPQIDLFASHHCTTFEDAIVEAVHAVEKQLEKQKTKWEKGNEKMEMEDSSDEETKE
jgi:ribosomal subunit interface protein